MQMTLANIEPEKWRRYYFESKDRYYIVILQQDLFHEWSIMKCYGGKENKLGNLIIESCNSYEDAANKIEQIKKIRRRRKYILKKTKAAKLGLNFEKIGLVVGNMV
jgi:hypothetical protein